MHQNANQNRTMQIEKPRHRHHILGSLTESWCKVYWKIMSFFFFECCWMGQNLANSNSNSDLNLREWFSKVFGQMCSVGFLIRLNLMCFIVSENFYLQFGNMQVIALMYQFIIIIFGECNELVINFPGFLKSVYIPKWEGTCELLFYLSL